MVDVGTHTGQEYSAVFLYTVFEFIYKFLKIFILSFVFITKKLHTIGFKDSIIIIKTAYQIRTKRKSFFVICVEPNTRLLKNKVYMDADRVFCLALGGNDMSFAPLFLPGSNDCGQGSSLFKNKQNISKENYDYVVRCSAISFAKFLKKALDRDIGKDNYEVILRINCEGSEDDTIYAFNEVFFGKFSMVLGALKDVGEIKGDAAQNKLNAFIKNNEIQYIPFSSRYTTWLNALNAINGLLK